METVTIGRFVIERKPDGYWRITKNLTGREIPTELQFNFSDQETAMRAVHRHNGDLR